MKKLTQGATRLLVLALGLGFVTTGWAAVPTPVAVWDGNFSTTKVNGWTLNANGNTVASDKSTITIDNQGFTITPDNAITAGTGVTVLAKMSGVTQNNDNDQILVCAKQGGTGVKVGTSVCTGAMTLHGAWNGDAKWNNANNGETSFSVPASGEFYVAFTTGGSSSYVSEGIYANGTLNLKAISGLRDSASAVQAIAIGGRPANTAEKVSGAVISRVMIYTGCLSETQIKDALDDMETTKSYSLQCQAAGNQGAVTWANFQVPYLTHYAESGSASLNTDKALRQITIPWRPGTGGAVNGSGATSLYLGITDSNGKLLALSSGTDINTVNYGLSSTFDFSQAYISAGTQYRYWFLNSNSYSLGDTITSGIQMGCALYGIGSNDSALWTDTMNQGNPYCPAARYWCSNMTESEFTATAVGTAVSTSGAYADDITLKGVADGKFTVGELKVARITLADADVTIEMDSGDSITAQYLDNSSQKLVIDASNGATAVGTYTLFEGTLASYADANLEVTFPTLGSGYDLRATKTANKISYQVDRTAVNATLTLTADCNFSEVKDSIGWIDSNFSTLEIVNNQESPITLTFDENITASSITVSGTGTTIIESSNSAVITAGTVTIPSGSTCDATGSSITTGTGAGTFIWKAGYPATVPAGTTYQYVGGATAEASVTIPAVTVNGTLKTSGHIVITNPSITAGCSLEVLDGNTTIGTGGSTCQLKGNIKVDAGATLTNTKTDTLDYNGNMTVDIYGTLAMGTSRWSITGGTTRFNLYAGSAVTGAGDGAAGLDFIGNRAMDLYGTDGGGTVTVEGPVRIRNSTTRIWIAENMTLNLAGGLHDTGHSAGFSQVGPGTLKIGAHSDRLGATSTMTQGKLVLNNTTVEVPVTLDAQASFEVVATEEATTVPVNVTTASDNVTFSGAGKVNGTITKTSAPGGNLATALQSSAWTGTFVADWVGANGTRFDINSYGNANSVVEVTKLAGGYVSGSNANVTVIPTVKVSGTMTLDNGYSGKTTTFTKLTGSGTVTFNTYTCDITTLDNFTGTLTPTDSYGTSIGTINLTATPAVGAKVVTLGTGANIRSIANTKVSVNGVVDENFTGKLEVKSDGIYVKSNVTVTVPAIANTTVTVTVGGETIGTSAGNYDVVAGSVVTVTYAAASGYEISGTTEYTIDTASATTFNPSGTTQVEQIVATITSADGQTVTPYTSVATAFTEVDDDETLTLTTNYTLTENVEITKSFTLAGSGDVTVSPGGFHFVVTDNAEFAIAGSVTVSAQVWIASTTCTVKVPSTASTVVRNDTSLPMTEGYMLRTSVAEGVTTYWIVKQFVLNVNYSNCAAYLDAEHETPLGYTPVDDGSTIQFVVVPNEGYESPTVTANNTPVVPDSEGWYSVTVDGANVTLVISATIKTFTLTIPVVEHATAVVKVGGVATDDRTFDYGTAITVEWTPASGYKITAGATQTINAIATDVTATAPTVEAKGATVSDVNFSYGADYATATVTATVTGDATAYTLTVGGTDYAGSVSGSTVTFSNVATGHATAYDSVSYAITASDGTSSVDVSGGSGSAVVADSDTWVFENSGTTGTAAAKGSWATAVTYNDNVAAVENNTFTANNCSTGDCVTATVNDLVYTSLSDTSDMSVIANDSQGAVALGETNVNEVTTMCFMILAKEDGDFVWKPATWGGNTPQLDTPYDIAVTFDYAAKKYSVCIDGTNLTVNGATKFDLCAEKSELKSITFNGEGTLRSIEGIESTGYMVKAANGTYYETFAAAIAAYKDDPTIGELYVLHDGTVPVGWMIVEVGGVKYLRKAPKGSLFIAF